MDFHKMFSKMSCGKLWRNDGSTDFSKEEKHRIKFECNWKCYIPGKSPSVVLINDLCLNAVSIVIKNNKGIYL